jgi:hypothetical protein
MTAWRWTPELVCSLYAANVVVWVHTVLQVMGA